jgi:hypothetical protein
MLGNVDVLLEKLTNERNDLSRELTYLQLPVKNTGMSSSIRNEKKKYDIFFFLKF